MRGEESQISSQEEPEDSRAQSCSPQMSTPAISLCGLGGSRLPDPLGESVLFRPDAGELFNLDVRPEPQGYVAPLDGLGIRLWVNDRKSVEDGVMIDALVAFRRAHFFGVRKTRRAKPSLVIEARGFNHECVVSFPMADGVSVPRRIGVCGKRSPVGPDRAPLVFALEELQHPPRSINELCWRGHKHDARKTDWIALQNRVIAAGAGSGSVSRYLFVEPRFRPRRHRRHILLRSEAFSAAGALILPDSREVTFGSGRCGRLCRCLRLTDLSESSGRDGQGCRQRYHPTDRPNSHFAPPECAATWHCHL